MRGIAGFGFGCRGEEGQSITVSTFPILRCFILTMTQPFLGSPTGRCLKVRGGEAPPSDPLTPAPHPATTEQVVEWVSSTCKPLPSISTKTLPEGGESFLVERCPDRQAWQSIDKG